ncbi:uncharacterized protein N7483_009766 [Penicillium malachiteum]|uniref:uncharacterized protein n=1 Tax=Penicillium malachiteum TaxID=1324776 RepID=UPI0025493A43|nr:uncharacterized protein N7483_009766 [Penicillium malachiteum]KAJ5721832.1 hypothetical protein N7483_009766 [Penicillium malachiteum]
MSSSTSTQGPLSSESDHEDRDSSKSSDPTSPDLNSPDLKSQDPTSPDPTFSAQTDDAGAVVPINSPSSSRIPAPGTSRRHLTNEEFLVNAFKALDQEKLKIDYYKLAGLCGIIQKSAGIRWGSLRRKHGLTIKGFYTDETLDDADDANGADDADDA